MGEIMVGILGFIGVVFILLMLGLIEKKNNNKHEIESYYYVVYNNKGYRFPLNTTEIDIIKEFGVPASTTMEHDMTVLIYHDERNTVKLYFKDNRMRSFATFKSK